MDYLSMDIYLVPDPWFNNNFQVLHTFRGRFSMMRPSSKLLFIRKDVKWIAFFMEVKKTFTSLKLPVVTQTVPLDGTHLDAVRGLITKRNSTQERQREELVGASLLRPIRTNRSSLTCRCQFPDSR